MEYKNKEGKEVFGQWEKMREKDERMEENGKGRNACSIDAGCKN